MRSHTPITEPVQWTAPRSLHSALCKRSNPRQLVPKRLCNRCVFFCPMTAINGAEFGVVVSDEQYFSVWPTHRKLPFGWHFTGPTGTRAEMQQLVEQQFVSTISSTRLTPERQFRNSQSAD